MFSFQINDFIVTDELPQNDVELNPELRALIESWSPSTLWPSPSDPAFQHQPVQGLVDEYSNVNVNMNTRSADSDSNTTMSATSARLDACTDYPCFNSTHDHFSPLDLPNESNDYDYHHIHSNDRTNDNHAHYAFFPLPLPPLRPQPKLEEPESEPASTHLSDSSAFTPSPSPLCDSPPPPTPDDILAPPINVPAQTIRRPNPLRPITFLPPSHPSHPHPYLIPDRAGRRNLPAELMLAIKPPKGGFHYMCPYEGCSGLKPMKPSALKQHLHVHTGERPHRCTHCGNRFPKVFNLHRHQTTCKAAKKALQLQLSPTLSDVTDVSTSSSSSFNPRSNPRSRFRKT